MDTINNQMLFEFIEQANRPVSLADLTIQFDSVPRSEIFKCIAYLKEAGWIDELSQFTWDITEKAIAQSNDLIEGERQERIHREAKHVKTKVDLKQAREMLKHYPAIKFMTKIVFFISIGLSFLIIWKWIKE